MLCFTLVRLTFYSALFVLFYVTLVHISFYIHPCHIYILNSVFNSVPCLMFVLFSTLSFVL